MPLATKNNIKIICKTRSWWNWCLFFRNFKFSFINFRRYIIHISRNPFCTFLQTKLKESIPINKSSGA
ncbi:unnamed protein product [Blepharisma stoltei]|uniref:Uncharacterized protein n=1 Tax=Blepharisma stoltei TaxID=1481888 RepID=A0AAU9IHB0_9CILI|nr:unnamed protein product [Blepharisma stoltei]